MENINPKDKYLHQILQPFDFNKPQLIHNEEQFKGK